MVRIKICGVTSVDDAVEAALLGADAIGLNFYPGSPRYLTAERAQAIICALPPFVEPVGLFVNAAAEQIRRTMSQLGLRTCQLHSDNMEAPASPGAVVAFPVFDETSLVQIHEYVERCRATAHLPAAVLVDAHVPGLHGGTGQLAPWELLAKFRPGVPLILAGGLTPDNVAQAIRQVAPYGVDVASGVESSPGRKDVDKMRRFIDAARGSS